MTVHDLILRDATVFDGTAAPRRRCDVAVDGDRVAALGDLSNRTARREVSASGLALAPGFIDAHTHDDRALLCDPTGMTCKLSQGVTTVVTGNCGVSLAPLKLTQRPPAPLDLLGEARWWTFGRFAEYADRLHESPPPVNALALIGHLSLRVAVMGTDTSRAATQRELVEMQKLLEVALTEGAAGFSTGLAYPPGLMAPAAEVVALAQVLGSHGGIYTTHMRDEGSHVVDSVHEALDTGERAECPVVISHHKCTLPENFGKSSETLGLIDTAATRQAVHLDAYPYIASSTVLLPDFLREDIEVQISWSVPHPDLAGHKLADIALQWGTSLREAAGRLSPAGAIYFSMDERDVRRILTHPRTMIGSDGLPHDAHPHPRLWGTFPRVLGRYAREQALFDMETAVHKMTGLTARVFGLRDRGIIRVGAYADLVLFDPLEVRDRATFEEPTATAAGILECWVNGRSAYTAQDGVSRAAAGRLLQREAA